MSLPLDALFENFISSVVLYIILISFMFKVEDQEKYLKMENDNP